MDCEIPLKKRLLLVILTKYVCLISGHTERSFLSSETYTEALTAKYITALKVMNKYEARLKFDGSVHNC